MLNTAFAPWPSFDSEEQQAVANVLASNRVNYWTGNQTREFESEFAAFVGTHHAVAVTNGTLALDLALKALEIGAGDEVIVTPRTFIASVSSVVTAGATPVFADIDCDSGNIDPATIEPVLSPRTKAIIPVHLAGWPCDMTGIMNLAHSHGLSVVEDCAQAHGARIGDRSVGSFGDIAAWSFCQDKIITTGGEGGMVTTERENLWNTMWSYKDHGKSWQAVHEDSHPSGFRWVHNSFGTNWRMLEIQAVIGRIQLGRLAEWTAARTRNALALKEVLDRHDVVRTPLPAAEDTHAFYRLYSYVEPSALRAGWTRDRIVTEAVAAGMPLYQGSCPEVYQEKAFDGTGLRPDAPLPVASKLGETSLMMLTHPSLTDGDMSKACSVLEAVLGAATR